MPVQIGRKESDFSNPLGLLSDCHRRIEGFLGVLVRISGQVSNEAPAEAERESVDRALAYFRKSAPKHTADEEESLFPRLRESDGGSAALERLAELEEDHDAAERDHEFVDQVLSEWLAAGTLAADRVRELREALGRLSGLYRRHIALEDGELFPLAAKVLGPDQLAEVGREMAARRGVRAGE
jgi:hemerythrin-like domain-containing protein